MRKRICSAVLLCLVVLLALPTGSLRAAGAVNPPPTVLPAVREWVGGTGQFTVNAQTVIVYTPGDEALTKRVAIAQGYFRELFGLELASVADLSKAKDGDIVLQLDASEQETLGEDGYVLTVDKRLTVTAPTAQGLFYGVVTAVQSLDADGYVPCGQARDYAYYPVRSGMVDVGRAYVPLEYVEEITKYYAYFKMNEIHLHINDTGENGYSAFRLESDVEGLTSTDGFYSKEDYRAYQKRMLDYGVEVITEIDTPAHSTCFVNVVPELMLDDWHLDITKPETLEFVKGLFDEYLTGEDPVFVSKKVHIGADEYSTQYSEEMRAYIDALLKHVRSRGYTPRFWGSFGNDGFNGETPVMTDAETNFWAVGLSDYRTLFDMGYDVINTCGPVLYVVPGGNYGFPDAYDLENLYTHWYVQQMGWEKDTAVDADHPQLKGGCFALWNDRYTAYGGFSYYDIFERLRGMVCLMAEKTWCGEQTREIPVEDFLARYEALHLRAPDANPGRVRDLPLEGDALKGVESVGFPYLLSVDVRANSLAEGATLFSGADGEFYVSSDGALGFRRGGYDFRYTYKLPQGEWVNLQLYADRNETVLIVDDTYVYHPKNLRNPTLLQSATFVLPLEHIGAGFDGEINDLRVLPNDMDLQARLANRNYALRSVVTVSGLEVDDGRFTEANAVDGNPDTRLSFSAKEDVQWMIVDLGQEYNVNRVVIDFYEHISDYKLYVSTDGETFTEVAHETGGVDQQRQTDTVVFETVKARYIKYEQLKRFHVAAWNAYYSGGICQFEVYGFDEGQYQELTDRTEGCPDLAVRQARRALLTYLKEERIYETHVNGLAKALESAYAAYLGESAEPDASGAGPSEEISDRTDAASGGLSGELSPLQIALIGGGAAVILAAGVGVFLLRKKKTGK